MAERIYSKKAVDVPTVAMTQSDVTNPAPSTVQSAALNGGTTDAAQRVYKKKEAVTAAVTPNRTYAVKPEVQVRQAQSMWDWLDEANDLIQSTIEYATANEGKWVSGYASEYTDRVKNLIQTADAVAPYIELYKGNEEAYKSITDAFNEFKTYLGDFDTFSTALREQYDQYPDEASFNKAVADQKKWQEDAAQLEKDVEMLAGKIQYTQDLIDLITAYDVEMSENGDVKLGKTGDGLNGGKLYDLEKKMDYYGIPYEVYDNGIKRERYKEALEKELSDYEAEYNPAKQQQVVNAAAAAKADPDYEAYVADGKRQYKNRYKDYKTISSVADERTKNQVKKWLDEVENYDELWSHLTADQKETYYYLLGKYGHEDASVYFEMSRNTLKQEAAEAYYNEKLKGKQYEHLYAVVSGWDRFSTGIKVAFGNTSTDDRLVDPQFVKSEVVDALGEKQTAIWYNFKENKWETTVAGKTTYQIGYDMLDNATNMAPAMVAGAAASLINPAFGKVVQISLTGLSTGGNAYKEAIDSGAEHYQAVNYAFAIGVSEAVLDKVLSGAGNVIGGSFVGNVIKNATSGIKSAAAKLAINMAGSFASEWAEESLQELLVPFYENMLLDADNTWDDIDWEQVSYAGFLGGLTALAMQGPIGVASVTTNASNINLTYRKVGKQFLAGKDGLTIDKAIAIGLNNAKGTDAYIAATKIQQKVKNGEKVSAFSLGRMVVESQSQQAQISKGIENTVLTTAKALDIETDAAETVAAAAVALGQKVEFVSPEQMHNRYMAGEYVGNTDTVRLNAAELDTGKLISAVLAHEMVHAAEGTNQLQVLEKTVRRIVGDENWNNMKAAAVQNYATRNAKVVGDGTNEALANWITQNLFRNKGFAEAVANGDANVGNAFFYLIDRARRALAIKKENPSARDLAMLERLFMQAIDARTPTGKTGVQGAIVNDVVDDKGNHYPSAVLLDTDFFDGLSPQNWGKKLREYVESRSENNPLILPVEDENGNVQQIQFADKKDRVTKKGKANHKVLSELYSTKDNISKLAVIHIDEILEISEKSNPYYTEATEMDNHQWLDENGWLHRTAHVVNTRNGAIYQITVDIAKARDGRHILYATHGKIKRVGNAEVNSLKNRGSRQNSNSDTNVAQNATDVNTQSMQEGAGISAQDSNASAQGALLSEESMAAVDNGTWRDIRAKRMAEGQSPSHGDAVTAPFTQGGHAAGAATQADVEIDEDAVLREALGEPAVEQTKPKRIYRKKGSVPTNIRVRVAGDVSRTAEGALNESPRLPDGQTPPFRQGGQDAAVSENANGGVRSQVQGRKQVDVSDLKKTNRKGEQTNYDHDAAINRLETELGKDELLRRMYNATRMDRPKGTVEVDGRQVDAGAYMDAYERQLPDDVAALEKKIRQLEKQRSDEILRMQQEGTLDGYTFGGLKLDLQLFAAQRKYDLLQLDPGESGTEVRQFYEKRLRGTDANHNDQLVEMLAGRNETYNPICNEETLAKAEEYLKNKKKEERLLRRIGEYNNDDMFSDKEVAASIVLINRNINDGELGVAADMIIGLSRKGTIAGRAVQAFSMMARMTPEGTLKAAIRTVKSEADTIICKGADEKLDVLADDIVKAIEEAEENGLSSEEIIDRIRKGVVGKDAPVQFDHVPQDLADQVSEAMGTDVTGYTVVVSAEAMQAIVDGGANVETLVDTEAETLQIIIRDGADTDTDTADTADAQQLTEGKKRLPAKLTREELVQLLSEDLAAEKGTYFTQEQLYDMLWKVVEKGSNIPEQVRRYVLKKIREDDGGLAQRIYEVYQKGDLNSAKMRRAMEEALELPHLTDEDLKWIVEKATEIQSLESEPVKQADAMEELYDYLGAKMHVSTLEMLAAWRKFSMLFNVKTHLRNLFSNAAYKYVRKADAAVAMAIERIFVKDESKRGAALGWSHTEHGQSIMPALQKQAELAVLEMQGRGPKYEQGSNPLKRHRKMFGTGWLGEKFNKASDWNSNLLEAEDLRFFRPAYIDALGQLMTARGKTEITTELHDIAMQRALEATFRNRNYISEWLSVPRRGLDSDKEFVRVMASLYDVALPFITTPAAVAEQAVWHSPIGLIKGAYDIWDATKGKGSKDIATAINTFSKGVTGTALFTIGFFLGKAGLFHVGFGRTEKERAADEMNGVQDGALVIGNFSISLDWLQPAASPLIVGASLATNMREKGWSASSMFGAVFDGTDSLFELTMLQSLYDVLGGYEAGPSGSLASIGENAVSQSTPTLVGQLARAIDPVQRKTKGDNAFETAVNKVLAKIPGLTYLLDPELDVWGNEVYRTGKASTGSAVLNAVQQFGIPSNFKIGTAKDDPISKEILRLYNTVEDRPGRAIPTTVSRDEAKEAGVDYVEINKKLGAANRLAAEAFINNEKAYTIEVKTGKLTAAGNPKKEKVTKYYRDMTDAQRADVLSNIYEGIKGGLIGDASEKSEDQLNDNQAYYRYIIEQSEGAGSDADAHPYKNDPVVMEILKMYENPTKAKVPGNISREEAEEAGGDYEELNAILDAANRLAVKAFINNEKAYTIAVETGKLTAHGNPQTKMVAKYYSEMTDEERQKILSRIYTNNKAGLVGDASQKTEKQLTDNEKYYRRLLDQARKDTASADNAADDAYYRELLRRAKNGY